MTEPFGPEAPRRPFGVEPEDEGPADDPIARLRLAGRPQGGEPKDEAAEPEPAALEPEPPAVAAEPAEPDPEPSASPAPLAEDPPATENALALAEPDPAEQPAEIAEVEGSPAAGEVAPVEGPPAPAEPELAPLAPTALVPSVPLEEPPVPEHAVGDLILPPGVVVFEGEPHGERRTVGIVVSRFNGEITNRLLEGAMEALEQSGVTGDRIDVMAVPGAFELPLGAMALAKTRRFNCIVALGCVIRGDTPHFDYVCSEAASGLQLAGLETGVPVAFGVLTCDTREQAEERSGGARGNKGAEAVRTALEMADVFARLRASA